MDLQAEVNDFKREISEIRDDILATLKYILASNFIVNNRLPAAHEWQHTCRGLKIIWRYSDNLISFLNSLIDPIDSLRTSRRLIEALLGESSIDPGKIVSMAMVERMRDGVEEILYHFNNDVLPEIDSWARQVFENQKAELHY